MMTTRVLLADGHRSFAEALAIRLQDEPGVEVVAVVVLPEEGLRVVAAQPVDVAVLAVDSSAPGFLSTGQRLLQLQPDLKLIGVAGSEDSGLLARAVREGFRGWVPKEAGIASLLEALHAVRRGETYIPPAHLTRLLAYLLGHEEERQEAQRPLATLTARELEVLRAMAKGEGRHEIAEELSISANTVRTHMQSILNKLGVHSSLAAITIARRAGVSDSGPGD